MSHWRVLADDLTGALDTAAAFAGVQDVPVFLNAVVPESSAQAVQVVSTGTRDVTADHMAMALQTCLPWFTDPGHFSFKKIDSLLRGNSFAEVAWLLRHGAFDGVVFAPAFPAQGRFTQAGQHWAGAANASGAARETTDVLAAFAALDVPVSRGADMSQGGVLVPDVLCDADLDLLAAASRSPTARRWLWCGSAGLAWALARQWQLAPGSKPHADPTTASSGLTHLVTASRHPVLRAQLSTLRFESGGLQFLDLSSEQPLAADVAQAQLIQRTQSFVQSNARPDNLVVVGGDTLLALCRAAGAHSLQASASPRLGWGRARLQGGRWDGVTCYARSGAFGAPDDLSELLATFTVKFTAKETTP